MPTISRSIITRVAVAICAGSAIGQTTPKAQRVAASELAPSPTPLVSENESELRAVVSRYSADRAVHLRRYDTDFGSGFAQKPEDTVGMMFWRMHRAARVMVSLGVHMGTMTPNQAIDLLVDKVGHERANAEAEVRGSFNGTYTPVYQAAYMLGALQFRALRKDLVESGKMTNPQFHDLILQGGRMPVEMVRARLLKLKLPKDYKAQWRFYKNPIVQSDGR